MESSTESTLEDCKLDEIVHPYMCLYDAILDPTFIYEDSDDDSEASAGEDDLMKKGFIRTSPLQKYPVKYATRIYNVFSEDNLAKKDEFLRPSPPKVTFTKKLPRIIPDRQRLTPKKSSGTPTASSARISTSSHRKKNIRMPRQQLRRENRARTAKKQSSPIGEDSNSPHSVSRSTEVDIINNHDDDDDDMRRYPKRKRVSCDIFVSETKTKKRKRQKQEVTGTSRDDDDDDDDDESVKSEKKPRKRYYSAKYDVDYDEIAKEKSNEDYSKDVVTDVSTYNDNRWNAHFRELLAYYRKHGHTMFSKAKKNRGKHLSLLTFCVEQRKKCRKKRLHPDRFRRLLSIDFDFDPLSTQPTWRDRYDLLVAFKEKHGHVNVKKREPILGPWCRWQRCKYFNYKGEQLPYDPKKIELLESIGFLWCAPKVFRMRCREIEAFYKRHGHFDLPSEYPDYLGRWLECRQEEYARNALPKDYERALRSTGFDFEKPKKQSASK